MVIILATGFLVMTAIIFVLVYPRKVWIISTIATVAVLAIVLAIKWDGYLAWLTVLWLATLGIVVVGKLREHRRA
jgi:hypothetical protein